MKVTNLEKQLFEIKIRHPSKINLYHDEKYNIAATRIQRAWKFYTARLIVRLMKLDRVNIYEIKGDAIIEEEQNDNWSDEMIERFIHRIRSNVSPYAELFTSRKHIAQQCCKLDKLMGRKKEVNRLSHPQNLSQRLSEWVSTVECSIATKIIPAAPAFQKSLDPPSLESFKQSHKESLKIASGGWWRYPPKDSLLTTDFEFESWIMELQAGIDINKSARYF